MAHHQKPVVLWDWFHDFAEQVTAFRFLPALVGLHDSTFPSFCFYPKVPDSFQLVGESENSSPSEGWLLDKSAVPPRAKECEHFTGIPE